MVDQKKFERLRSLIEEIQNSQGQQTLTNIDRIQRSFRVVARNRDDLIKTLDALENEKTISLWNVDNRELLREATEVITTKFHNFLAAAFALVDHMRAQRAHLYSDHEFDKEIKSNLESIVLGKGEHHFAQGLRVFCLHVGLPNISATLQGRGDRAMESPFRLKKETLLEWDGWSKRGRKYINDALEDIRLRWFVDIYFDQINKFYEWLWHRQGQVHAIEIEAVNKLRDQAKTLNDELYGKTADEASN